MQRSVTSSSAGNRAVRMIRRSPSTIRSAWRSRTSPWQSVCIKRPWLRGSERSSRLFNDNKAEAEQLSSLNSDNKKSTDLFCPHPCGVSAFLFVAVIVLLTMFRAPINYSSLTGELFQLSFSRISPDITKLPPVYSASVSATASAASSAASAGSAAASVSVASAPVSSVGSV